MASVLQISADDYVREYETTMHPFSQLFLCTTCFVRAGLPVRTATGAIVHLA